MNHFSTNLAVASAVASAGNEIVCTDALLVGFIVAREEHYYFVFRFYCTGVESSNYGIFGSIPLMARRVPKSLHSKTLKVVDSGGLRQLRNIYPFRMGKQATLSL